MGREHDKMTRTSAFLLLWGPRILGLLVCAFIGIFALDAFAGEGPVGEKAADFFIHLLPSLILAAVVAISFRWPLVGALVFSGIALYYVRLANGRVAWIALIAGPLLTVGLAFLWSWWYQSRLREVG
jgi:hypothetical protein